MNIKGIEGLFNTKQPTVNKVQQGGGFKQILDKTLSDISMVNSTQPADSKTVTLAHGNRVLDLLGQYAEELSNPSTSLKEIDPLIAHIEKAVIEMQSSATHIDVHDKDLKQHLNDIAVTANVAILKYQRGDYI